MIEEKSEEEIQEELRKMLAFSPNHNINEVLHFLVFKDAVTLVPLRPKDMLEITYPLICVNPEQFACDRTNHFTVHAAPDGDRRRVYHVRMDVLDYNTIEKVFEDDLMSSVFRNRDLDNNEVETLYFKVMNVWFARKDENERLVLVRTTPEFVEYIKSLSVNGRFANCPRMY